MRMSAISPRLCAGSSTPGCVPTSRTGSNQPTLPKELAKEFGGLGVMGMHLDGYGCAGTNAVSYGLACMELEAGDSGFRSFVSVQGSLSMFSIHRFGSEEQKQQWLPRLAPAMPSAASD